MTGAEALAFTYLTNTYQVLLCVKCWAVVVKLERTQPQTASQTSWGAVQSTSGPHVVKMGVTKTSAGYQSWRIGWEAQAKKDSHGQAKDKEEHS
jgi:hypothetical protein